MKALQLNLAGKPFLNRRPVHRVTVLLWVAGAALLAANLVLYWQHFTGQERQREELAAVEAEITTRRQSLERAASALAVFDLEWQNQQASFINARIAERAFSWSDLFDRLAEVLPAEVQIKRLSPDLDSRRDALRSLRRAEARERQVRLEMTGFARTDDSVLQFVDRLYAHSSFSLPNLAMESRQKEGVAFTMSVVYLPGEPDSGESVEAADPGEEGS